MSKYAGFGVTLKDTLLFRVQSRLVWKFIRFMLMLRLKYRCLYNKEDNVQCQEFQMDLHSSSLIIVLLNIRPSQSIENCIQLLYFRLNFPWNHNHMTP